jgi:hypothetical protein
MLLTKMQGSVQLVTFPDSEMDLITARLRSCWSGAARSLKFRHTVFNLTGLAGRYYGMAVILTKTRVLF